MTMGQPVRVGLSSFAEYVNIAGTKRSTIIEQQVARYLDAERPAWWPYRAAEMGCREALQAEDPSPALLRMVAAAPPRMERHYEELRRGMETLRRRFRSLAVVPTTAAVWMQGELTVRLSPVVGLSLADGRRVAAWLYFKEPALMAAGLQPALRIMEYKLGETLPDAVPAVLDNRRGRLQYMPSRANLVKLDRLLASESAGYLAHWQAAAPSQPKPEVVADGSRNRSCSRWLHISSDA